MMKLFKKKKSDSKLSSNIVLSEPILEDKKSISIPSEGPFTIVMPKPRRILTPTRAVLGGFEYDKTQIEESPLLFERKQDELSLEPILQATSDDNLSRVYDSALESLSEHEPPTIQAETLMPIVENTSSTPKQDKTDILLRELKAKVFLMEKQQAIDRAEWQKKEQELLDNRNKMMEKLIETENQLSYALKQEEARKLAQQKKFIRSKSEERLPNYSPSNTLVTATPHHNNRPRAKSIDQPNQDDDYYIKPRKSYSSIPRRAPSYYYYYDDDDDDDEDLEEDDYSSYYTQNRSYPYSYRHYPMMYPIRRQYTQGHPHHAYYGYS